ncbi:hypothetical protein GCK72_002726 [Caenorhabditis remanei]|nr:hypothetical protein GCK72_002726 [Caenorhabditis remanei]KAF1770902.1 hypothetical protein GCK72_002726 [Caenorhabditis remanei]
MIQKTTILFMALALLAIFARGQNNGTAGGQNNTAQGPPPAAAPAPAATEVEGTGEPAGNGTSSSAYLNYGLGASFVLLAAL